LGSSRVNPPDPFLVHQGDLPELADEQWTAHAEIGMTDGQLTDGALSRETRRDLIQSRAIAPAGPGRAAITSTCLHLHAKAEQRPHP
jgi:hypothetical protein